MWEREALWFAGGQLNEFDDLILSLIGCEDVQRAFAIKHMFVGPCPILVHPAQ